ncbi:TOMM precursor leader peptide-binding protein [Ornithinibacillus halotolerans]|uniref:Bacteriocin biosynthesis cyclodehydratase domain-containing protein n=1 Tax=Ornithinibacillus halotolerans TaxID=1274357 RepID=A0A916W4S0_9BACI|nr:TOMM precursor leader peptide-binding protein [Ornithinibacillus halotolerans]GGA66138.1 hypothetical protein GCM10008025_07460 [Ornithinibacillus halotolerans]
MINTKRDQYQNLLKRKIKLKPGYNKVILSSNKCYIKKQLWGKHDIKLEDPYKQNWIGPLFKHLDQDYTVGELLQNIVPAPKINEALKLILYLKESYIDFIAPDYSKDSKEVELLDWFTTNYRSLIRNHEKLRDLLVNAHVVVLGGGKVGSKLVQSLLQLNLGKVSILENSSDKVTGSLISDHAYQKINSVMLPKEGWVDWIAENKDSISLAVVAIDEFDPQFYDSFNLCAINNSIKWSLLATENSFAYIGPTFIPQQTGCFQCYMMRKSETDKGYSEFIKHLIEEPQAIKPYINPSVVDIAVGYFILNLPYIINDKPQDYISDLTIGRQFQLDFRTNTIRSENLIKYLSCPSCTNAYINRKG